MKKARVKRWQKEIESKMVKESHLVRGTNGRFRTSAGIKVVWSKMSSNCIASAREFQVRLNRNNVNMVRVGLTSEALQINECVRHATLILNELKSAVNWSRSAVAEPLPGDGLVTVSPQDGRACHPVAAMFRRVVIVDQDGPANDRMRTTERKVRIGEELDRIFDVSFSTGDVEESKFVDEISHLATHVTFLVRTIFVRLEADLVRIVMAASAQAPSSPVEEIFSGHELVDVPSVITGVILAAV